MYYLPLTAYMGVTALLSVLAMLIERLSRFDPQDAEYHKAASVGAMAGLVLTYCVDLALVMAAGAYQ